MEIHEISISQINLAPYNPRKDLKPGDEEYERLLAGIKHFGLVEPVVVNRRTQRLVGGHQRVKVLSNLGHSTVQAVIVDLPEADEKVLNLALNRIQGEWDLPKLSALLLDLDAADVDLNLTGFTLDEISSLLSPTETIGLTDEDAAPEAPEQPVSSTGDLWILGSHRVKCGDSTILADNEHLMGQDYADLLFTDPPFGMNYGGGRGKAHFGAIENDGHSGETLRDFLEDAFARGVQFKKPGAATYICFTWRTHMEFRRALGTVGITPSACIVWAKQNFGLGHQHYRPQHEFIFYAAGDAWYGGRTQSDVWEVSRDAHANYTHPTQKPVELIERAIRNSSKRGDIVLDLFGGSGSSLIAAEKTRRHARLMELDPKYADVIIRRWQEYTGGEAKLSRTGQTFSEVQRNRVTSDRRGADRS
jgi:DNA modification methylase